MVLRNSILIIFLFALANLYGQKPNIVLILADDQGWGDLSFNGNSYVNTPNIDALAKEGTVFNNFFVSAVCSPTRAELLTGRYAVRGGVYATSTGGERLDLDETTIATYLNNAGYKTGLFGKWHNGMQYPYHPNGRGFQEFYGFCSGHIGSYFNPVLDHNGTLVRGKGFLPDDLTNKAITFIEASKNEPFFLFLSFNTPHSPMMVPDSLWHSFKDKKIVRTHRYSNKENTQKSEAAYALTKNIDTNVGEILKSLKRLNLEDNTIVIYLSDNGPNGYRWNNNLKGIKGDVNEGGVKSPFVIRWKNKILAGTRIDKIASSLDLLPTLLDLASIRPTLKKLLDGQSLKPLLFETNPIWKDRYIVSYWKGNISVRGTSFRLGPKNRLYNMMLDSGQKVDVSKIYKSNYDRLLKHKSKWEKEVLSELPKVDKRAFTIGYPTYKKYQLPAQDAILHGNLERSNRWPNSSYITNWTTPNDSISWPIQIKESGMYSATIYYSCDKNNVGSTLVLSLKNNVIKKKIVKAHNPDLDDFSTDRIKRVESYTKIFEPLNMGLIELKKGKASLSLKAIKIRNTQVMDFKLLMLTKIE